MIFYNGIELDIYDDTIKPPVINGGLTDITDLSKKTGTASTEFVLPRTANNELAFENITTEGSQGGFFDDCQIYFDGNLWREGTLYVKGYDKNEFKCVFFGNDVNIINDLRDLPLRTLFETSDAMAFTDANIRTYLQAEGGASLGDGARYHFGHPFLTDLESDGDFSADFVAPFFNVRHMVYKLIGDRGYSLTSNFFDSDYGTAIDYSNFEEHFSSNLFTSSGEQMPTSGSDSTFFIRIGTADANNNSITPTSLSPILGAEYTLDNAITKLRIRGQITATIPDTLDDIQIAILVEDGTTPASFKYSSVQLTKTGQSLQNGVNYIDFSLDQTFASGDNILFLLSITPSAGISHPISGASVVVDEMIISHDNIQQGDYIFFGDYMPEISQLDFLSGLLKQFNLVMDVEDDNVHIELQDSGVEPIGGTPATLPSIVAEQVDISDKVDSVYDVSLEYLQNDLVYLKQKLLNSDYPDTLGYLPYQEYGGYLFKLNTFNRKEPQEIESYFNCMLDSDSYSLISPLAAGAYVNTWENYISLRYKYDDDYDGTYTLDYINADLSTTSVDALVNWSEPVMIGKTWAGLFKNTLLQMKNNKVLEITLRDNLGTLVSNRKEYILNGQVYKLISWSYDLISKIVTAQIRMK